MSKELVLSAGGHGDCRTGGVSSRGRESEEDEERMGIEEWVAMEREE